MTAFATQPTAVQFGAGNIGRGFIAQLFHESGLQVVFVDVVESVIESLNSEGAYTIRIVGPGAHDVRITGVGAVNGADRARVARELSVCRVACTAVGAGALRHVAPAIAAGLELRHRCEGGPLNILVCENLHDAGKVLRSLVAEHLAADLREEILDKTGFPQAVVSRMVPLQTATAAEPLMVRVEAYKRLPIDGTAIVPGLPPIVGVEPVSNFAAHEARKLFTHNCAHATLGYLGWLVGCRYGYEALVHPDVRPTLDDVLAETGAALIRQYGFDPNEHRSHVADLLERFANVELGDTCFRLARDPIRKLGPEDRLVGAARLCERTGVRPAALAKVIAAALRFDAREDHVAVELQRRISEAGLTEVLNNVCGIRAEEPLGTMILGAYAQVAARRGLDSEANQMP